MILLRSHIDKMHRNDNSFLIIPILLSNVTDVAKKCQSFETVEEK